MLFNDRCCDMNDKGMMMDAPAYAMPSDMGMNMGMDCCPMPAPCQPVVECPQERCCHREIVHEVPHIIPINTRIINHHVYRHTYTPRFTCTEENEVSNVYERNCNY